MRLAQISPLWEPTPGAFEAIRALTVALRARGHEITVFGPDTAAMGQAVLDTLQSDGAQLGATVVHLAEAFERAASFDLVHSHVGFLGLPYAALTGTPTLTTPPERLDEPNCSRVYAHFRSTPLASLSAAQQVAMLRARWLAAILPAVDLERWTAREQPGSYLVWYGRLAPDQRPDRAIDAAVELGIPLKIGGRISDGDRPWFDVTVRPHLSPGGLIEWVGELTVRERQDFFAGALAMLALPDQPEPFPYPAAEAMACGTPVVALHRGAYPELVADGLTGVLVSGLRDLAGSIERAGGLDRQTVRADLARRCDAALVAERHERVYRRLTEQRVIPADERLVPEPTRTASGGAGR